MKTLQRYKHFQVLLGVFLACLILSVGLLMSSIATWEQLPVENLLSKIILTVFPVMLTAGMTFIALVSKSNDLKFLYYSAFAINLGSLVSAIFYYWVDETCGTTVRSLFAFARTLGLPFGGFATALRKKLTYIAIGELDVLMIFLLCLLVSVAVHQLYKQTDTHDKNITRWKLENPARIIAMSSICFYGAFIVNRMVLDLLGEATYSVENLSIIYEIINVVFMFFWYGAFLLTISAMVIILPVAITLALLIICTVKAIKTSNPRQIFNPLVILAIVLSVLGSYMMYTFTMSGF